MVRNDSGKEASVKAGLFPYRAHDYPTQHCQNLEIARTTATVQLPLCAWRCGVYKKMRVTNGLMCVCKLYEGGRHRRGVGRAGSCKMDDDVKIAVWRRLTPVWLDNSNSAAATMVCILSSTYSEPLHKIRFYTRAKQIALRQHCINCIELILHRTVTIVSNLNGGKTASTKKYVICFLSGFAPPIQCFISIPKNTSWAFYRSQIEGFYM